MPIPLTTNKLGQSGIDPTGPCSRPLTHPFKTEVRTGRLDTSSAILTTRTWCFNKSGQPGDTRLALSPDHLGAEA
jgi:hypothetical protein